MTMKQSLKTSKETKDSEQISVSWSFAWGSRLFLNVQGCQRCA